MDGFAYRNFTIVNKSSETSTNFRIKFMEGYVGYLLGPLMFLLGCAAGLTVLFVVVVVLGTLGAMLQFGYEALAHWIRNRPAKNVKPNTNKK